PLETLKHVEPPATAIALERVGGVRDLLELPEDVLRHQQRPLQEPGLADVGDPAVNDDARVEDLVARVTRGGAREDDPRDAAQLLLSAQDEYDAHVGEEEREEAPPTGGPGTREEHDQRGGHNLGEQDTPEGADGGEEQTRHGQPARRLLERDDGHAGN